MGDVEIMRFDFKEFKKKFLTIGNKLAIWYTLISMGILVLFMIILVLYFSRSINSQIDKSLQMVATQEMQQLIINGNEVSFNTSEEHDENISPWVKRGFAARLLKTDGENSEIIDIWGDSNILLLPKNTSMDGGFFTLSEKREEFHLEKYTWRIYSIPVTEEVFLQIGESLYEMSRAQDLITGIMAVIIPLGFIFSTFVGIILSKKSLDPVNQITQLAQKISEGDIHRRLELDLPNDEIGNLSRTFNSMLDRLEEAFNKQKQFTSDAAHELRTPLTVMKSIIDVTLNRERDKEEYKSSLIQVRDEVDRLTEMVKSLLLISRFDTGRVALSLYPLDLTDIVTNVKNKLINLAMKKRISINLKINDYFQVHGNEDLLTRLFFNLIENAIKYSPEDDTVDVIIDYPQNSSGGSLSYVLISIEDNGPGIPDEDLGKIFDRFYRVDKARSKFEGTGLGLSIAKQIVKMHNGYIIAENKKGKGCIFRVFLPRLSAY